MNQNHIHKSQRQKISKKSTYSTEYVIYKYMAQLFRSILFLQTMTDISRDIAYGLCKKSIFFKILLSFLQFFDTAKKIQVREEHRD